MDGFPLWRFGDQALALDDRFHETGIDEPSIHGTRSVLADSLFENG
jgi:hypothetical protein